MRPTYGTPDPGTPVDLLPGRHDHLDLLRARQLERRFKAKFPALGYLWPKSRKLRETFASQGGIIQRRQLGEIIAEMLDGVEPVYRADPEEWL